MENLYPKIYVYCFYLFFKENVFKTLFTENYILASEILSYKIMKFYVKTKFIVNLFY